MNERIDDDEPSRMTTTTTTTTTYCTAALPGQAFQDIYICKACCHESTTDQQQEDRGSNNDTRPLPLCICQACAETCHANCKIVSDIGDDDDDNDDDDDDDAVDYIGVGPASCDCHTRTTSTRSQYTNFTGCRLYRSSCAFAQQHDGLLQNWDGTCTLPRFQGKNKDRVSEECSVQVFDIPRLQQSSSSSSMAQHVMTQAQILVQHSKDTFWIDSSPAKSSTNNTMCLLEALAYKILHFHSHHDDVTYRGCEWWVQVKPTIDNNRTLSPPDDTDGEVEDGATCINNAIEMHYDKDEDLAESFGLGVFPTKSTVTYLTTGGTSPTLIFPRTYHDPTDVPLPYVYASYPVQGKHLVFDGSLLHGAIPLGCDQRSESNKGDTTQRDSNNENQAQFRVTFLVNLWKDHRPMGIQILPRPLRGELQRHTDLEAMVDLWDGNLRIMPRESSIIGCRTTESQEWISLPFVQDGMIVKTVALPLFDKCHVDDDVVLIWYKEGFEARLDFPIEDDEVENDDDENGEHDGNATE